MAVYVECVCSKCSKLFGRIDDVDCSIEPILCPDCIAKEDRENFKAREKKRDMWLWGREGFRIEDRLKFIEEWIYDHDRRFGM